MDFVPGAENGCARDSATQGLEHRKDGALLPNVPPETKGAAQGGAAVNALPTPKIGDMATVLVPTDERHIKDLWWWDGAKVMIMDIHEDRCLVRTTDGYATWLYRRMLALANQMDVEA